MSMELSLGLIIYESMSGKFAFQRENLTEDEIIEVIIKAKFNYEVLGQNYPPDAIEMLKKMLHVRSISDFYYKYNWKYII